MPELRWVSSSSGHVALDDRTYPVVFATWIGQADTTLLRAFFAWNDDVIRRATRERRVFSMITDASLAQRPDAAARQLISELTQEMQRTHPTAPTYRVVGPVVLENPMVRSALTAVGWIMGTSLETEYAATCAAAIESVKARFAARGAPWPEALTASSYVPARR